jgi:hypothetical protein
MGEWEREHLSAAVARRARDPRPDVPSATGPLTSASLNGKCRRAIACVSITCTLFTTILHASKNTRMSSKRSGARKLCNGGHTETRA